MSPSLGAALLGALLAGCFDVEQVDTEPQGVGAPPRVIDDFNDDVVNSLRQPTDPAFSPWTCWGVNGGRLVSCDTAPGIEGRGRMLTFDLFDVPDGERDYQGAELNTLANSPVDFSSYARLGLSASFTPGEGRSPTATPILVRLYCGGLVGGDFSETWVEPNVLPVAPDLGWYTFAPRTATFHQPQYQKAEWLAAQRPLLNTASCLAHVEALGVYVQPDAADGERAGGTMTVDEIYVQ